MLLLTLLEFKSAIELQMILGKALESLILHYSKGNIYIKMAKNLLGNIPVDVIYRIDVDFRISEKNLDAFIGRTAHI
jgi:hypothetical protein